MGHHLNKVLLLPALVWVFSLQAFSQDDKFGGAKLSDEGKAAYQGLYETNMLTIGGSGFGNKDTLPKNERAFFILLRESDAVLAFRSLARNAGSAGRLYGLVGLKSLECECFQAEAAYLKKLVQEDGFATKIDFSSGCLIGTEKTTDLVDYIAAGNFDKYISFKRKQK